MTVEKPILGVFGAGWVGLVTGACFAEYGHDVVIRDVVPERIEQLSAGRLPFHEPGLAELIERNRERLTFTLDAAELKAEAKIFFCCVDTPPMPSGEADLAPVLSVVEDLGAPEDATLVMKSTVPVGTGERIRDALDGAVGYVSNPEFLSEGRAIEDFQEPGPDRHRVVRRRARRSRGGALRGLRRADRAHERPLGGDGQARVERVPRDPGQLHQRDRQRLRRRSAPTSTRSSRAWASTAASERAISGQAWATGALASQRTSRF